MATLSSATDCNPTITFTDDDVGKTFVVTQTVDDGRGGTDTTTVTIGPVTAANTPPVAGFTADNTTPTSADTVTITSTATDADGDTITCAYTIEEAA